MMRLFSKKPERIGRYLIAERISKGDASTVYKARHANTNVISALKIFTRTASRNFKRVKSIFSRIVEQDDLVLSLNHKNIVRIYDCGKNWGRFYYAMELVNGDTLESLLGRNDPWVEKHRMKLIYQVIEGVEYLHHRGLVHRDICPAHIMLTNDTKVAKIINIGRAIGHDSEGKESLWKSSAASYMAPEHIQDKTIDVLTDMYSLGITIYKILTGNLPFLWHDDPGHRMQQHMRFKPFPLTTYDSSILPLVEQVVMKAIERDPGKRYQSVSELRQAVDSFKGRWRDTRRHPRYAVELKAAYSIFESEGAVQGGKPLVCGEGIIRDISQGGAQMQVSEKELDVLKKCYVDRHSLILELTLSYVSKHIEIVSKIRRIRSQEEAGKEKVTVHLFFEKFYGDSEESLDNFLKSLPLHWDDRS